MQISGSATARALFCAIFIIFLTSLTSLYLTTPIVAPFSSWSTKTADTRNASDTSSASNESTSQRWRQAIDFPVVALVFYGRREYVSILDCYLQRNLKKSGGLLDEVIFIVRTEDKEDLNWLERLLSTTPEYSTYSPQGRNGDYADSWGVVQNGTMYIKIDDDVVFFEDHTIDAMLKRKLENPNYFLIAANSINQPAQSWVHYHLGAPVPYLPELSPAPGFTARTQSHEAGYHNQDVPTWRASELPQWTGPPDYTIGEDTAAPFVGHRWLPLPPGSDIDKTPISAVEYQQGGPGWHSWVVAAQTHYSFFENLEKNKLHKYKYDVWDYHYARISINFILVSGEDVLRVMPLNQDDEYHLTQFAPKNLGRHAIMEGSGLAVHFGFGAQQMAHEYHGIHDTDALDRYRAFAEERACGKPRGSQLAG